ncbi:MAG: YegP family protein [Eubacterium sp.]|nr:YegP family protein [Eubacterium sp.]
MGKFVIKPTKNGGFKFDLKATNGQVVASSQVYKTIVTCKNGIASVTRFAPIANIEDQTVEGFEKEKHPKFEIYTDKAGETRFRLKASNGQVIATSEGYTTMKACKNGIASVQKNVVDAPTVQEE